jgi:uncharacterized protein (DUF3084 family)
MNTPTTSETEETARLEKLRTQLSTDIEVMQQKEASLREYEQKLRLLVEHASTTQPPMTTNQHLVTTGPGQAALDAEWEKYQRANALLEAARRSLTDDRLALKDREEKVMIREQEVARREAWIKAREQQLAAKLEAEAAETAKKPKSSFTTAPFLAARNFFSHDKKD